VCQAFSNVGVNKKLFLRLLLESPMYTVALEMKRIVYLKPVLKFSSTDQKIILKLMLGKYVVRTWDE